MSDQSQRISELDRISTLTDDDFLILQRNNTSFKVSFSSFKSYFMKQFNAKSGVGDAISAYSSDFAPFAHGHDYSDFWFYPSYGPQSNRKDIKFVGEIGTFAGDASDHYPVEVTTKTQTSTNIWKNTFKIASYNVLHCSNGLNEIVDVLKTLDANVYCLQEIDKNTTRSGKIDQLKQIAENLGKQWKYTFSSAFDYDSGKYGIGMLYLDDPISIDKFNVTPVVASDEPRILQVISFSDYIVVNTHLCNAGKATDDELDQIAKNVIQHLSPFLSQQKPIWLCGCLNNGPKTQFIKILKTKFTILSPTTGTTSPVDNAIRDYVLLDSKHAQALPSEYIGRFQVKKYDPGINQYTTSTISAYAPPPIREINNEIEGYQPYVAGDIQCLAVKNFKSYLQNYRKYSFNSSGNIDIYSSSFDGFVIPDGSTYQCNQNDFKDACRLYSPNKSATATSFTVPDLKNVFFKCDPGLANVDPLSEVPFNNAIPSHDHGGSITADGTLKSTFQINLGASQIRASNTGTYVNPFVHWGSDTSKLLKPCPIDVINAKLHGQLKDIDVHESGDDAESYPKHQCFQVLLYIGKK